MNPAAIVANHPFCMTLIQWIDFSFCGDLRAQPKWAPRREINITGPFLCHAHVDTHVCIYIYLLFFFSFCAESYQGASVFESFLAVKSADSQPAANNKAVNT